MHFTFNGIGETCSNLGDQIHITKCTDIELYNQYAFDMADEGNYNYNKNYKYLIKPICNYIRFDTSTFRALLELSFR